MFNDFWLLEQGFIERPRRGTVADLVVRRHDRGGTIFVGPDDTLKTAYARMRSADVSQLPVLEDGRLVGLIDESDLLAAVVAGSVKASSFAKPVRAAMTYSLETLDAAAPIADLLPFFARDRIAIVTENGRFIGLVTRVDLLNHLHLHPENGLATSRPAPADPNAYLEETEHDQTGHL